MARIFWLDDEPHQIREGVESLRRAGHTVEVFDSESSVIAALERERAPDLLLQDLERFQSLSASATSATPARMRETTAGWRFYEEVFKPRHPQVPVVICTYDAHFAESRRRADDFGLDLVPKHLAAEIIVATVEGILARHVTLHSSVLEAPGLVGVDFARVTECLIRHLAQHPADLHEVSWGTFESLVQRLLQELGYEVLHTPLTRDGGADLWALHRNDLGEVLYAIDTKKYAPTHLVGPEPVRAIYGVAGLAHATAGMIVTTSHFGPGARRLARQYRYRVALRDFEGVVEWLKIVTGRFSA